MIGQVAVVLRGRTDDDCDQVHGAAERIWVMTTFPVSIGGLRQRPAGARGCCAGSCRSASGGVILLAGIKLTDLIVENRLGA
jgi:hypothetical protein